VQPGDKVPATLPDGTTLTVTVDKAAKAGSVISFTIPSSSLPEWKTNLNGESADLTVAEADLEFQLAVERDVQPGDKVPATLPDGTTLTVTVDKAAKAGSVISFTIPSSSLPEWKETLLTPSA